MATVYEKIVQEDLDIGFGTVSITNPAGGSMLGTRIPSSWLLWRFNTVAFSATPTFDLRLGNFQKITLTANVTSATVSSDGSPQLVVFEVIQDTTGGWTFAWPSNVFGGIIQTAASKINLQMFLFDGTNAYPLTPLMAY